MAYIYVITNKINGKQYVGKTNDSIDNRFKEHLRSSEKESFKHRPLYAAMRKYGKNNFSITKLDECSENESSIKERYWIEKLNTYGSNGYNATYGGDGALLYDYKKISNDYINFGSVLAVCKKYNCDKWVVQTACKHYGIVIKSGQDISRELLSKSVYMFDKNGRFISNFPSLHSAAKYCLINKLAKGSESAVAGKIGLVARSIRKSAYGYVWKFNSTL